jgi:hypothetical protein
MVKQLYKNLKKAAIVESLVLLLEAHEGWDYTYYDVVLPANARACPKL